MFLWKTLFVFFCSKEYLTIVCKIKKQILLVPKDYEKDNIIIIWLYFQKCNEIFGKNSLGASQKLRDYPSFLSSRLLTRLMYELI